MKSVMKRICSSHGRNKESTYETVLRLSGNEKVKRKCSESSGRPEGDIVLDATGRKNGRGAYICPSSECLKKAIKSKGLSGPLKVSIPQEIYDTLTEEMEKLGK